MPRQKGDESTDSMLQPESSIDDSRTHDEKKHSFRKQVRLPVGKTHECEEYGLMNDSLSQQLLPADSSLALTALVFSDHPKKVETPAFGSRREINFACHDNQPAPKRTHKSKQDSFGVASGFPA